MKNNRITFLGTGTSTGIPMVGCHCDVCLSTDSRDTRLRTSAMIEYEGMRFQIDVGPDFRAQMLNNQMDNFDAILITHEHRDHVAGMDDLRALNIMQNKRFNLYCNAITHRGIVDQYRYVFENSEYASVPKIDIIEVDHHHRFNFNGIEVIPIEVIHGKLPILGYRIGSIAYITDASFIAQSEIDKLKGLKVLVLNALRKEPHHTHFTLDQAMQMAERIGAEQTYFTHFSHQLGKHEEVQKLLPHHIGMAYDGLKVEF